MTPAAPAAAALEQLLNGYLGLAPDATVLLAGLTGRRVRIEMLTPLPDPLALHLWSDGERLHVEPGAAGGAADAVLRGSPFALARLAAGRIADSGAQLDGDPTVAAALKRLFSESAPDGEEVLSRITGDLIAHQVTRSLAQILQWQRRAMATVLRDAGEYLQFENGTLAPSAALTTFCDQVDRLREDTDRVQARIDRLTRSISPES